MPSERFILWNPDSDYPPRKVFDTLEEASEVAASMSLRHDTEFHVCQIVLTVGPDETE